MKIIITENQYNLILEQFDDFGDVKKFQKLKRDYRRDTNTGEERGIGKVKSGLMGSSFNDLIEDLKNEFNLKKIKYTGRGYYGMAFIADNDKILKITPDKDEIRGIEKIVGKEIPGIVNYYGYKEYPEFGLYGILMDKANPISKLEKDLYTTIYYMQANHSDSDFWDDYDEDNLDNVINRLQHPEPEDKLQPILITDYYGNEEDEDDEDWIEPPYDAQYKITENELKDYIDNYRNLLLTLENNNIDTKDLHGENIGQINGELVHFDIMAF